MPSRKKSDLSRKSRNALRQQQARSQDSEEDRGERLSSALARQAASLSAETASQRESRLRSQRHRTQYLRSLETSDDRDSRRSRDRNRHSVSRASETFTQWQERLTAQRIRTKDARSSENEEKRNLRLYADRERHALSLSRMKVWRSEKTKKKPVNEEIFTYNSIFTHNSQLRTYARLKSKICLEATYSAPSTSTSTVTAEPVVGQSSFVQVVQNKSEIEMLLIKLEPPEYYKQHTQGDSSTTAAASSIPLKEELEESGLLGETEVKIEKIEIGEEGLT